MIRPVRGSSARGFRARRTGTPGGDGTSVAARQSVRLPSPPWTRVATLAAALMMYGATVLAQLASPFTAARQHPAIDYTNGAVNDAVAVLGRRIAAGEVTLRFDQGPTGYLQSILDALGIDPESQLLVFSKTSFQAPKIGPENPRALYFNDHVTVGWVRGGDYLEFAAQDPRQGTMFYTLRQAASETPQFERNSACLACHVAESTRDVPGMFAGSIYPNPQGNPLYAPVYYTDHRSRLVQRWGGWYVTGRHGSAVHMGNGVVTDQTRLETISAPANQNLLSLDGRFDRAGYPSPGSDIVALMVLEHQMHMMNLLTRAAWEVRIDAAAGGAGAGTPLPPEPTPEDNIIAATRPNSRLIAGLRGRPLREVAIEIVDYMLYVDEAPFTAPIAGSSQFAERFAARGPKDGQGRSLRQFDLQTRLMRYPLSHVIYSDQFDALPASVKDAIYRRLWLVLSGGAPDPIYRTLSAADRQAIVEILRATKPGLPDYFAAPPG